MRRREPDREALAQVLAQATGYLALTAAVVWILLRMA
jgi:hypothetical protein